MARTGVNTRDKILTEALRLFNEKGLYQVTMRSIAVSMGISVGNLNYYFKKKEEIIEALYFLMVAQMSSAYTVFDEVQQDHLAFKKGVEILCQCLVDNRWLMLDFVQVMREQTTIRTNYHGLIQLRKSQTRQLFDLLVSTGIMHPEKFSGQFDLLFEQLRIATDFYLPAQAVVSQSIQKVQPCDLSNFGFAVMLPYLTAKGERVFMEEK